MLGVKKQPGTYKTRIAQFLKSYLTYNTIENDTEEERLKERFVLFKHYAQPSSRDVKDHEIFLKRETLRVERMIELLLKERTRILKTMRKRTFVEKVIGRVTKEPANLNLRQIETHIQHLKEEQAIIRFEKAKLRLWDAGLKSTV